jgi:hypothetical protein
MSRLLPSRPNLDHLRNQAKDLLATARAVYPAWQLADAQFALARDYGFPSWPAMKAHVDAVAAEGNARPTTHSLSADSDGECLMTGVWVANLALSTRHPAARFESATLDIRVHGTRVTMTQLVTHADGQPSGSSMTLDADDQPHTLDGASPSHQMVARWLDARTLEAVDTKDGVEMGRGRYEVTSDGRTLVVATADQRLVFDRK